MIVSYSGPRHQLLGAIRQRSIEAAGQCCECDILTNSAWLIELCALSAHTLWRISPGYAELFCCFELSGVFFRWHSFSATVSHFSSIFSDRIPACHNCNCRAGSMAETSDSRVLSVSETLLEAWPQKDCVGMRKTVDGSLHVIACHCISLRNFSNKGCNTRKRQKKTRLPAEYVARDMPPC